MSRLAQCFDTLNTAGRTALIPYLTAGDPAPDATVDFMHALVESGADVLELGIPFTDPMADGPVIQAACERALAHDTSLSDVLDMVATFRSKDGDTPVVLMGYLNPIDRLGLADFAERARVAGVDGVLIVDMTAEEAPDIAPTLRDAGLDPICLVAPTTGRDRIAKIGEHACGFIYYVSFKGVTGAASLDVATIADKVDVIRSAIDLPVAVGFGVRTPGNAADVARVADAVVVGSTLVRCVATNLDDRSAAENALRETLSAMRHAIDREDESAREARRA